MTFVYPWAFLLLLPWFYCLKRCPRRDGRVLFSNVPLLKELASGSGRVDGVNFLRFGIVFSLLLALARPILPHAQNPQKHEGYALSLILDASNSMHEEGRFSQAKKVLSRFVASRPDDRFALSVFGDFSAVSLPMTEDHSAIQTALKHVQIGVAGGRNTALYEAVYRGVELADRDPDEHPIAILLTDGLNTVTSIPLRVALAKAKKHHFKVYTIGLGHDYQKPILQKIADETGGKFFALRSPKHLGTVYDAINRLEPSRRKGIPIIARQELYRYPLLAALILMVILGWFLRPKEAVRWWYAGAMVATLLALIDPLFGSKKVAEGTGYAPVVVALDLSRAMDGRDVYPSRLMASKTQVLRLIKTLPTQAIGLIGFDAHAYLISPPTRDHAILRELIAHLDPSLIRREDANLSAAIQAAGRLLHGGGTKDMLLVSSGGDAPDMTAAILQAHLQHIRVHIDAVATGRGTTIPTRHGVLLRGDGTPVLTQRNPTLPSLSDASGGVFVSWNDSDALIKLRSALERRATLVVTHREYHPSWMALLAVMLAWIMFLLTHVQPWGRRG